MTTSHHKKKSSSGLKKKAVSRRTKLFKKLGTATKKKTVKKVSKVKRVHSRGSRSRSPAKRYSKSKSPKKYSKSKSPKKYSKSKSPKKHKKSRSPKKYKKGLSPKRHRKAKKEEGKPKRALNSFMFFAIDNRKSVSQKHPSYSVTDIGRKLGEMWRSMGSEDKAPYERMAAKDKERSARERSVFVKSRGPKKPASEFIQFSSQRRRQLKEDHPDWSFGQLSKAVGAEWSERKGVSSEGKKHKHHHHHKHKDVMSEGRKSKKLQERDDEDEEDNDYEREKYMDYE